eukprot:311377_1
MEGKDLIIGYPDPNTHIARCGNISNSCNSFHPCFSDYNIASQIDAGRNITVTVTKDAMIQSICDTDHPWCINAILTLNCDDRSTSPTTDPTIEPTAPTTPRPAPTAPTTTIEPTAPTTPRPAPTAPTTPQPIPTTPTTPQPTTPTTSNPASSPTTPQPIPTTPTTPQPTT